MGSRTRRVLLMALAFVSASLYHQIRHRGDILLRSLQMDQRARMFPDDFRGNYTPEEWPPDPRLEYIRIPGDKEGLWEVLDEWEKDPSNPRHERLPKTPAEIARKYDIPKTSRDVACRNDTATTVGWIPSAAYYASPGRNSSEITRKGRIPRLIFQSWKTNELKGDLCRLVLNWSVMNPSYDYFLFDDASVDAFVREEYGREVFSSYACVRVGAAKCDVWRLLVIYLFGGIYFDADVRPRVPFEEWGWGDRDVVTARSCTLAPLKHPGGCAHQWGLIYAPRHPVIYSAVRETLGNLAERKAQNVYDVSFWSYYHAWRNGPYNRSYMPRWGEEMGGRVSFQDDGAKGSMVEDNGHWQLAKRVWHPECLGEFDAA